MRFHFYLIEMYNPLKYFTDEFAKNLGDRAKEVLTFLYPPVTMYEDAGEMVIEADLPGFSKKDVTVRLEKNALTISAERKLETKGVLYLDQRPEKFTKRIRLPMEVDQDVNFKAKLLNGVLTVRFPAKGVKTIEVE
ncbi:MAG: Hsp20/alpha crystallin family protein [Candidatus Thermoplasmatota archaeon]|jgi:HSP20 family molecular chaperone IbpA|nr:Hsp20/alpha crystallin family protein [Candidatus Thermoplasmatota archaeon]MCL5954810.1 Hsp20/alpha crystallin family protein [Candidatus Thermoplasmatota archaeon]